MKALIQRVNTASVMVDGHVAGEIQRGLLVLLGVDRGDDENIADGLLEKLLDYRVFPDSEGRMNLSVRQAGGAILLVSQFTLSADTRKGLRPSFSAAASPAEAKQLYDHFLRQLGLRHPRIASGVFGADMQVSLVNDGPVTFLLESFPAGSIK